MSEDGWIDIILECATDSESDYKTSTSSSSNKNDETLLNNTDIEADLFDVQVDQDGFCDIELSRNRPTILSMKTPD